MAMSLAQLQTLVRDRHAGSRHDLLCALADLVCDPAPEFAADDRALVDDIIAQMLDSIDPLARREFAEQLAAHPAAPRRVVLRLAGDVGAVAAPLLAASPVLSDDDLAALAGQHSDEHLLAIARRDPLSERITDILLARGSDAVLDCLAANPGAWFSAHAAAALNDRAALRETRARRDAATPPARPLDELSRLVADATLRFSEAVIELADADRAVDLATLICCRTGGDRETFLRHLYAPGEMTLMAACRAALLDLESFSAVMRLRHRRHPIGGGEIARLLRAFQELPVPIARARAAG